LTAGVRSGALCVCLDDRPSDLDDCDSSAAQRSEVLGMRGEDRDRPGAARAVARPSEDLPASATHHSHGRGRCTLSISLLMQRRAVYEAVHLRSREACGTAPTGFGPALNPRI
jgi:hypothetical protein